jgi:hypothetical protein
MHVHFQRLVSVVRMVAMLEEYTAEEHSCHVFFYGQKDWMQRIFIKKCFLFMVGSVCCIKQFTPGSRTSLKNEQVEMEVQKWLRRQSKDFYAVGFDASVKR